MSLKAKIEAVIYAAEEPVTLAQLAGLFTLEAMEARQERLEQEAAVAAEQERVPETEQIDGAVEAATSAEEPLEAEQPSAEDDGSEDAGAEIEVVDVISIESVSVETVAVSEEIAAAGEVVAAEAQLPSVEDEKRAARQRDREIREELRRVVDELIAEYESGNRGMEIREIAGGYRVATKPEYHDAVRSFVKSLKPPMKLSLQALETLAVIAYKQPVTAPEVSEIRGVDSAGVLGSLITRKLITTAGRKQVIGRPILYKTTKEFLLRFGLKDLNELPSIEEFEKMAGELEETEPAEAESGELPFAQNEIAAIEEDSEAAGEGDAAERLDASQSDEDEGAASAARASIAVAEEADLDHGADLPGVAVHAEVHPADLIDSDGHENGHAEHHESEG
jgi:segregation and condensation protein B